MLRAASIVLVLAMVVSVADAAPPELALGAQQLELEPRRDLFDDEQPGSTATGVNENDWLRSAAFVQLTAGGRTRSDVGAGLAFAHGGAGCDLIAGSAQGRLQPLADDDSSIAGEVTYSVCPIRAYMTLALDGKRGTGIAPSLAARRSPWNRRYDEAYDRLVVGFGPVWHGEAKRLHTFLLMSFGHGTTTQSDDVDTRTSKTIDFGATIYRYEARDHGFGLDVLAFESSSLKAGNDNRGGVTGAFYLAGGELVRDGMYLRAKAGWGFTGGQVTLSSTTEVDGKVVDMWSETIDGEGLPTRTEPVGEIETGVTRERVTVAARAVRSFYPTFDGNVAREARVEGSVTVRPGPRKRTTLTFAPFATRTRTWTRDDGSWMETSGGASLHFGRPVTELLRIDAIGQAGVSPYAAQPGGDRLPAPTVGGQVLVALSGRVTELQAKKRR